MGKSSKKKKPLTKKGRRKGKSAKRNARKPFELSIRVYASNKNNGACLEES